MPMNFKQEKYKTYAHHRKFIRLRTPKTKKILKASKEGKGKKERDTEIEKN